MLGETPVHVGAESPTQSLPSLLCFFFFFCGGFWKHDIHRDSREP